jgi:hypothetical protein
MQLSEPLPLRAKSMSVHPLPPPRRRRSWWPIVVIGVALWGGMFAVLLCL